MFLTRLCKLGANHPFGRVLFKNLGLRYLVFRFLLPRLNCLLDVKASRIANPLCFNCAANTISPVESLTSAIPVCFAPGSIFNLRGELGLRERDSLRIIVNGKRLKTAAFLFHNNCLACAAWIGSNGLFSVSKTNILDIKSLLSGNVSFVKVRGR